MFAPENVVPYVIDAPIIHWNSNRHLRSFENIGISPVVLKRRVLKQPRRVYSQE